MHLSVDRPGKLVSKLGLTPAQSSHVQMFHDEHPASPSGVLHHLREKSKHVPVSLTHEIISSVCTLQQVENCIASLYINYRNLLINLHDSLMHVDCGTHGNTP